MLELCHPVSGQKELNPDKRFLKFVSEDEISNNMALQKERISIVSEHSKMSCLGAGVWSRRGHVVFLVFG